MHSRLLHVKPLHLSLHAKDLRVEGRDSLGQSSIAALLLLELSDRLNSMLTRIGRLVKASLRP